MTNTRNTTTLIPTSDLPTGTRVRLGLVRTLAFGLIAGGAIVALGGPFAGSASAGPIVPQFPITIPPQTIPPVTLPPKPLPPFGTIPPVIVADPGTPPTIPPTVPPTTAAPTTAAPTTVAPNPTTTKKPSGTGTGVKSGTATNESPVAPVVEPVVEPVVAVEPTEEQVLAASASDPLELGKDDSLPILPIVGGTLIGAALLVAGGLAIDKRRKA